MAATSPLAGGAIAVSGTHSLNHATIHDTIISLGGEIAKTVNPGIAALISTQADVDKQSTKVKAAMMYQIPIVSMDWLDQCVLTNADQPSAPYLLLASTSTTAPAPALRQGRSKHPAVPVASPVITPPVPAASQPSTLPVRKGCAKKAVISPNPSPVLAPISPPTMVPVTSKAKGKKRAASPGLPPPPPAAPEPKKPKTAVTIAQFGEARVTKGVVIPLDEYCPHSSYTVYVDDGGLVYDAALNQTNASHNNNKYYRIQLLHNQGHYQTWTRWGRVGDRGATATLGNGSFQDALKHFEKKFKDKSGLQWRDRASEPKSGKYAYLERSYEPDSDVEDDETSKVKGGAVAKPPPLPKTTLPLPVQSLLQLIFNRSFMAAAMSDLNYDSEKLPLGKLSKANIARAFQSLKDLAALLNAGGGNGHDIEECSNRYYSLIPHNFGRSRPPVIDADLLKKELDLLDSLHDMKEATELMKKDLNASEQIHPLDRQFSGLGLQEMTPLDPAAQEFQQLEAYLVNTRGSTHKVNFQVQDIFRIQRNGEFERFDKSPFANIASDRRLLWHGSRATNFGGILSQGLRIAPPEAPVSGYMFGKGIYLADMSSKSANYCCSYNSGGHALLLLCEAELGSPMHELTAASYSAGEDAIAKGSVSTWGKGMEAPLKWKDAGCVNPTLKGVSMPDTSKMPGKTKVPGAYLQYNEFITYDVAQVRLRYLFRVKMD
ncbi:PARP-domain-containing protein [Pleomassaria siparia CBS 279.74]|uniref:Poly [ADP-ribose] polymerase n=1 Tax=Pleomassaria siparia CBS 279.74 TaxID=1314801 RepID=A0A6G1KGI2_9PLEO|nr:PARP-domain-containing protein [Pleomassaria siparia CBS 279.74]